MIFKNLFVNCLKEIFYVLPYTKKTMLFEFLAHHLIECLLIIFSVGYFWTL